MTIDNARNLMAIIDRDVNGLQCQAIERNRVAGALYDIAHDHGKAIVVLIETKIYSSAFALVRPLFESYVRAAWIHYCASNVEIQSFISNDKIPDFISKEIRKRGCSQMLSEVEQKNDSPETLSKILDNNFKAMCSYTHGGILPIFRRLTEDSIEPVFEDQEIDEVIRFTSFISFLSFCGIINLTKPDEKTEKLHELRRWVETWCFDLGISKKDKVERSSVTASCSPA